MIFFVPGKPAPQGSKVAMAHRHSGKPIMREGNYDKLYTWRNLVAVEARKAWGDRPPTEFPVKLGITFCFVRPKSHFGTGRNAGKLKPHAPQFPTSRSVGDLSKLVRAIEDAMTGIVYDDDSRIVRYGDTDKSYVSQTSAMGAYVNVREL